MSQTLLEKILLNATKLIRIKESDLPDGKKASIEVIYMISNEITNIIPEFANKYKPVANDKIYIYPDSGIPRFKLKEYCQKNKISLIKDHTKANARFINLKTKITDSVRNQYCYIIKRDFYLRYLNAHPGILTPEAEGQVRSNTCGIYLFDYKCMVEVHPGRLSSETFTLNPLSDGYTSRLTLVPKVIYDELISLIGAVNIYSHEDLVEDLGSGLVMDKNLHHNLKRLFESKDQNNHMLAMESMANCDYQESAVYLLLLFKEFGKQIFECYTRNHVNFKSLRNYFKVERASIDADDIVSKLRERGLATKENINLLIPEIIEDFNFETGIDNFKVDSVVYKGELDKSKIEDEDVFEDLPDENLVLSDLNDNNSITDGENNPGTGE